MRFSFVVSRVLNTLFKICLLGALWLPLAAVAVTFDFSSGTLNGDGTSTYTQTIGSDAIQVQSIGDVIDNFSSSYLGLSYSGNATSVTVTLQGGKAFDLASLEVLDWNGGGDSITVSSSAGSQTFSTDGSWQTISFTNLNGVTSFTMTSNTQGYLSVLLDNIVLNGIISPPTVTGLSPASGASGTSVAITGTNFTGATAVTFGGTAASSFTVNSATSITATAPAGTGTVNVQVTNAAGTSSTGGANQYTYLTAPGAPTGVTATAGNGQATVNFTAPASNGGSAITTYTATASPGGATGTCAGPAACAITVSGLSNSVAYTFTVIATNSYGNSPASAPSAAATPTATAPNAPTAVTAVAGNAQATISFTAPGSNGGSAITGYTVTATPGGATATGASSPIVLTGLTNGTAYTFTVLATNAIGNSAVSAPSNSVIPFEQRADPTQDSTVKAMASHQHDTLKRFATAQTSNFMQRLEMLHMHGSFANGTSNGFAVARTGSRSQRLENQSRAQFNAISPRAMQFRPAEVVASQGELALPDLAPGNSNGNTGLVSGLMNQVVLPAAKTGNLHLNVASLMANEVPTYDQEGAFKLWGAGYVRIGKRSQQNGSDSIDYSTDGISLGADRRFMPNLTLGVGVGYARDKSDIGNEGSESLTSGNSIALYGSYQASPAVFIDGLLGYSTLDIESDRFVSAANDFARADRSGRQIFGSLASGYEYRGQHLLFSPYARYDFSLDKLDAVTETGAGTNALHYGNQSSTTQVLSIGLRAESTLVTDFGLIMPRGRVEYQHHLEGGENASLAYADQLGTTYSLAAANRNSSRFMLGAGSGWMLDNGVNLELNYQYMHSSQSEHSHGLFFGISKLFGGK